MISGTTMFFINSSQMYKVFRSFGFQPRKIFCLPSICLLKTIFIFWPVWRNFFRLNLESFATEKNKIIKTLKICFQSYCLNHGKVEPMNIIHNGKSNTPVIIIRKMKFFKYQNIAQRKGLDFNKAVSFNKKRHVEW